MKHIRPLLIHQSSPLVRTPAVSKKSDTSAKRTMLSSISSTQIPIPSILLHGGMTLYHTSVTVTLISLSIQHQLSPASVLRLWVRHVLSIHHGYGSHQGKQGQQHRDQQEEEETEEERKAREANTPRSDYKRLVRKHRLPKA